MRPGPSRPGRVTLISKGAAEIVYDCTLGQALSDTDELDILVADFTRGLYLKGIPVRTISDHETAGGGKPERSGLRKRVVAFGRLTADQRHQLEGFISVYAR
jgi:hypothetical protein